MPPKAPKPTLPKGPGSGKPEGAAQPAQASARVSGWLRQNTGKAGVILALLLGAMVLLLNAEPPPALATSAPASAGGGFLTMPQRSPELALPLVATTKEAQRLALRQQLELVDHTLCSYREATKYPNTSRPISEHADQAYPNRAVTEQHAMRKDGGGVEPAVQIQTSQSRVFVAAGEAVVFTIRAMDKDGKTLPLFVSRAVARGLTFQGGKETPQLALAFSDDGSQPDASAGDQVFSGMLAPDQSGFASFNGTIRTELKYNVDGRAGVVLFDIIYSPETPASWAGPIREAVEGGSLNFYLKANVRTPGRYVVSGRVDDAKGKPFALVTFNDLLGQGNNEIRLTVVGKLLRDQEAVLPLTLRDVDAYLLKENTDPDRALMPRIEGTAYVTKNYPLKNFSDAEWQSEERSRYLTEYGKDVNLAKAALVELDPEQARMPFPQSECSKLKAQK